MKYVCLYCGHIQEGDSGHLPVCQMCGEIMEGH